MVALWLATAALAVDAVADVPVAKETGAPPKYAVGARYKHMWIPASLLDIWFFSDDEPGALAGYPRPTLKGELGGIEFALQPRPNNFIFYVEYFKLTSSDGYFDDRESPADHGDGDWVDFQNMGYAGFGVDYRYEFPILDDSKDVWPSFLVGGGLGVGVVTGSAVQWHPGGHPDNVEPACEPIAPAPLRTGCEPDGEARIPPVLPIVDIGMALKVHIKDRAWVRADFGLHEFLSAGAAAGGEF